MKKRYIFMILVIIFFIMPILYIINPELLKAYLIVLNVSVIGVMLSFFLLDIKAFIPKKIKENYEVTEAEFKERKVFILRKSGKTKNKKAIFYLHGGSYVMEATYKHWQFLEDLVDDTEMTLIVPDYPLTPKYTYKDVFEMIEPLYKETVKKVGKENIILMGDSAGGGMALGLIEKLIDEKEFQPSRTILLSPWLDVTLTNPEITKELQKKDPCLVKDALKIAGKIYSGQSEKENYLVNPILGPIKGLKNIIIYTGTRDILNPDARKFYERAKKEGVDVTYREVEDAIHIWMTYRINKKEYKAEETYNEIVNLLKKGKICEV